MFQWLTRLVWHDEFVGEIMSGHGGRLTRRIEQHDEEKRERQAKEVHEQERYERERELRDPFWARVESRRKRDLLELKLKDAEWILEYEKRRATLQNKTARQRSQAEQVGTNTERLRKLEHHLTGLRRSLD